MGSLARILAPVEFSERCAAAARYAHALAGHFHSELTLLHVLPPAPPEMPEEAFQAIGADVDRRLREFLAAEVTGPGVRRLVVKGDPARKIVQFALDESADVILMATHGFGSFRRFILGSNTAKVLHDADCPVWTGVHLEGEPLHPSMPVRQILCAVDLGPQSAKTLAWAASLQRAFDAQLALMHVMPAVSSLVRGSETNWNVLAREAVAKELEKLRETSDTSAELLIEAGDAPQLICSAARRLEANLLVIGRGSAAGVFGRLRTNAYTLIRQSPCPVVSV